jgi:anaerobic dimethyl sulfoxide reductase subunit B (iron-sulfur subunit)
VQVKTASGRRSFEYDSSRCIACRTCEVACKSANNVEPGARWRRVTVGWAGEYPHPSRTFSSLACEHCADPACIAACSRGAITKRPNDGVVVVDREECDGCRDCLAACRHGVPQFGRDGTMQKCDFCVGIGREPVCTQSCPTGALTWRVLTRP